MSIAKEIKQIKIKFFQPDNVIKHKIYTWT